MHVIDATDAMKQTFGQRRRDEIIPTEIIFLLKRIYVRLLRLVLQGQKTLRHPCNGFNYYALP